ncbi:hypothetical protein FYJ24_11140 [Actinomycetaceae bacterium WB03_NA08]|uniref:Uncharacterized protein n=1 Tax=Scrofimicrobium canadense TaxID=2652290 RepID=A0A6N7VU45_9ACTO|nr:hypothetical protein [Scrofimicrobium canadense]
MEKKFAAQGRRLEEKFAAQDQRFGDLDKKIDAQGSRIDELETVMKEEFRDLRAEVREGFSASVERDMALSARVDRIADRGERLVAARSV